MSASTIVKSLTIASVPLLGTGFFRWLVLIGSSIESWEYKQIISVEMTWVGFPVAVLTFLVALRILSRERHSIERQLVHISARRNLTLEQNTAVLMVQELLREEVER